MSDLGDRTRHVPHTYDVVYNTDHKHTIYVYRAPARVTHRVMQAHSSKQKLYEGRGVNHLQIWENVYENPVLQNVSHGQLNIAAALQRDCCVLTCVQSIYSKSLTLSVVHAQQLSTHEHISLKGRAIAFSRSLQGKPSGSAKMKVICKTRCQPASPGQCVRQKTFWK